MVARRAHFWLIVFAVLTSATPSSFAGYEITDLGAYAPAGSTSQGAGLNLSGVVVGTAGAGTTSFAFRSTQGSGPLSDLGTLPGGTISHGAAINTSGLVAGDSNVSTGRFHAFTVDPTGQKVDIGVLSGWTGSHATGVNDLGQVVGYGNLPGGVTHAFEWTSQTGLVDLGTFGGLSSTASGINASGAIVGSVDTTSGLTFAFRQSGVAPVQIFGGLGGAGTISVGLAINDAGEVVGYGGPSGSYHAFRSRADGTLQDLATLPATANSYAYAVNNLGTIVGAATTSAGSSEAILFSDRTGLVDLNSMLVNGKGWQLQSATGVNDFGQITGTGSLNGVTHAYLLTDTLTAVPEPPSIVLAGLGLVALLAWHARRGCGRVAARAAADRPS